MCSEQGPNTCSMRFTRFQLGVACSFLVVMSNLGNLCRGQGTIFANCGMEYTKLNTCRRHDFPVPGFFVFKLEQNILSHLEFICGAILEIYWTREPMASGAVKKTSLECITNWLLLPWTRNSSAPHDRLKTSLCFAAFAWLLQETTCGQLARHEKQRGLLNDTHHALWVL